MTYWSGPFHLTNTTIGLFSTIYVVSAALAQPVFGFFSDRIGPRWLVSGGVLWMGFWFMYGVAHTKFHSPGISDHWRVWVQVRFIRLVLLRRAKIGRDHSGWARDDCNIVIFPVWSGRRLFWTASWVVHSCKDLACLDFSHWSSLPCR